MAHQESDREDLMQEATALVERVELSLPSESEPFVLGYRRLGDLSCFLGPDPVFHFDPEMRLKRAFVQGYLFRTQETTLARLERVRSVNPETDRVKTDLLRHDLEPDELNLFRKETLKGLAGLAEALKANDFTVHRQVPSGVDLTSRILRHLESIVENDLPLAPRFKGKR
ncbi:hypothetical protein Pla110_37540 [Polystyrenella longa]|uniref:Uncharacterized protein n=1 Tax=Polystyrenella longa TaxID=2528007 RepID=A0A518CRZ8_9PLAN|nr:hypothetical protein [Polystyrenella longa]QDU82002.1 hypothetical protein Pla110_37540 [Polystyrenella longa]